MTAESQGRKVFNLCDFAPLRLFDELSYTAQECDANEVGLCTGAGYKK